MLKMSVNIMFKVNILNLFLIILKKIQKKIWLVKKIFSKIVTGK